MQVNVSGPPSTRATSVESLMHSLLSIGRLLRQRSQGDPLDTGTFWLLKMLAANGAMRVTELAAYANLDISTVSRHVSQLDKLGLLERTRDPGDGRAQQVQLSEAGRERLRSAIQSRHSLLDRALQTWDADDLGHLDRLLGRFVTDLDHFNEHLETTA